MFSSCEIEELFLETRVVDEVWSEPIVHFTQREFF